MTRKINYTILDYGNIHELINEGMDDDVIKILSQIESSYPLTFFEKESLQKKVDKLDNYFWIKNKFGNCELVNQKVAEFFNSSPLQLEGNPEEMFFPSEFRKFVNSFNKMTSDTKTAILICGLTFGLQDNSHLINLINIPIIDAENNVIAIICLSCHCSKEKLDESDGKNALSSSNLDSFPFPTAIISEDNVLKAANTSFQEIVGFNKEELDNSLINKVFSTKFLRILRTFIASSDRQMLVESSEFSQKEGFSTPILLGKVFDKKSEVIAIFLDSSQGIIRQTHSKLSMIENLIRNNPDAVLICDKENLKFLKVNEAACNLYGYRREELLGMDLTDLYSTEDIQILLETSSSNFKEGIFHGPYKHRKKDGTSILVEMSRYSIKYNEREAHFNIIKDVSERLEFEKKSNTFKSVFNHTDDLIFITDSSGFISFVNSSVTKILGYTKNDLLNSSFTSLVGENDRSRVLKSIINSKNSDESSLELTIKSIDGRRLKVKIIASPILDFNNEVESFTIIGKVKQESLDFQKIGEHDKEVKASLSKSDSGELDSAFLKELFHELLTPINIILGFSQDISVSASRKTLEQAETAKIINQNRLLLLNSINTALEYATITDKNLKLLISETKLTEIINELLKDIEEWKKIIHAEFLYGKIQASLKFETDNKRFTYFLLLLFKIVRILSGQEKIYFSAYDLNKDNYLINFRDLPTHCSKALVNHLKNIFTSDDPGLTTGFGVSGVMIRLVKKLLQILKGEFLITAESSDESDYGIVFPFIINKELSEYLDEHVPSEDKIEYIDIDLNKTLEYETEIQNIEIVETTKPKEKPVKSAVKKNTNEKVDISNLSCLYFEDQVDSQILFSVQMKGLKNLNFAVSFEESLPLLDSGTYDFIVIDLNLQGSYNGLDILKIIRTMPKYENMPVFGVTAYLLPGDEQKFIVAGFNGFISKPIFRDQMIDVLAEVFNESKEI